jgi:hypothetical protein
MEVSLIKTLQNQGTEYLAHFFLSNFPEIKHRKNKEKEG